MFKTQFKKFGEKINLSLHWIEKVYILIAIGNRLSLQLLKMVHIGSERVHSVWLKFLLLNPSGDVNATEFIIKNCIDGSRISPGPILIAARKGSFNLNWIKAKQFHKFDFISNTLFNDLLNFLSIGHANIVKILIENGANASIAHTNGTLPLFVAVENGN